MNLLFEVLCVGIGYSAFCRAVHLDLSAMRRVRVAVTAIASMAVYGLYLRFTGWQPDHVHVLLLSVTWLYLAALSRPWALSGLPAQLKKRHKHETGVDSPAAR